MFANNSIQAVAQLRILNPVRAITLSAIACAFGSAPTAHGEISFAPGFFVSDYAALSRPTEMSFSPSGDMYVGNNTGLSTEQFIYRIPAGGGTVQFYGDSAIPDPDGVLFDALGVISGVPGSVLVGHAETNVGGQIKAIRPDGSIETIIGPDLAVMRNPANLRFDSQQRLLMSDNLADGIFVSVDGATASELIALPGPGRSFDVDQNDRIFLATDGGAIRSYDSAGALINGNFASGLGDRSSLRFGPGTSRWGDDLYVFDPLSDQLLRFDTAGNSTVLASGLDSDFYFMTFGPDDALYLSITNEDRIVRVVPEPSALALVMTLSAVGVLRRRRSI